MHWLSLIAAVVCMVLAMQTRTPGWAVLLLILAALGLVVYWMLGWIASQVGSVRRDEVHMLAPEEIRRLREQAAARKAGNPPTEGQG